MNGSLVLKLEQDIHFVYEDDRLQGISFRPYSQCFRFVKGSYEVKGMSPHRIFFTNENGERASLMIEEFHQLIKFLQGNQ